MITFYILSIFPEMFHGVFQQSILKRAQDNGLIEIHLINIRDYATDKHKTTDDYPFGGGPGMLMKVEPIYLAFQDILGKKSGQTPDCDSGLHLELSSNQIASELPNLLPGQLLDQLPIQPTAQNNTKPHCIFMSPAGQTFNQKKAIELAGKEEIVILCGRYEGIDERILEELIDEEVSIGDFVLTGGELPAMVLVDAIARMIPGVLGDDESIVDDSFYQGILGYPQYTRPRDFLDKPVPEVLLSGHHAMIDQWRRREALRRTLLRRPDLLQTPEFSKADVELLLEICGEENIALESLPTNCQEQIAAYQNSRKNLRKRSKKS